MKKLLYMSIFLSVWFVQSAAANCCPGGTGDCLHDRYCRQKCGEDYSCDFEYTFIQRKSGTREIFCVKNNEENYGGRKKIGMYEVAGRQYICTEAFPYQFDALELPQSDENVTPTDCPFCDRLRELKEK